MRVAFDLTAVRRLTTGVERVALASFRSVVLHERNIEWLAFVRPEITPLVSDVGAELHRVDRLTRAGRVLWQQVRLPSLLARHRVDLLVAPIYTAPLSCPCPVVLFVHDAIALEHPGLCTWGNVVHFRTLLRGSARRAWRIAVPSRAAAQSVIEHLHPRIEPVVLPPGIGRSFLSEPTPAELQATQQDRGLPERFLLAVGRLERKKNLPAVIQALPHLSHGRAADLGLVIVGAAGPDANPLFRAIRESPARQRIQHISAVTETELAHLYRRSECLVFPSLAEGFGIPPMECLAVGTPSIVSRWTPSYVERWGIDPWVLPSLEPETIARLIDHVLDQNVDRDQITRKCHEARALTWENHARTLLEIIRSADNC